VAQGTEANMSGSEVIVIALLSLSYLLGLIIGSRL
jgi:hypothetical protein